MEAIVEQEVNAFLPKDKWQIENLGFDEFEQVTVATAKVFGLLKDIYPVQEWYTGDAPKLIRNIIAMHVAAWVYARQFSEDTANINSYASWLLRQAEQLLASVVSGAIQFEEVEWPYDGASDGSTVSGDPIFTTGRVF